VVECCTGLTLAILLHYFLELDSPFSTESLQYYHPAVYEHLVISYILLVSLLEIRRLKTYIKSQAHVYSLMVILNFKIEEVIIGRNNEVCFILEGIQKFISL
jgi:hypothetical protein